MTGEDAALRQLAGRVLMPVTGSVPTSADLASAFCAGGAAFTRTLTPVIGNVAVSALFTRALTLTRREHPWFRDPGHPDQPDDVVTRLGALLEAQAPVEAERAAATFLATLAQLLVTFIGKALTMRLLEAAWPAGFSDPVD